MRRIELENRPTRLERLFTRGSVVVAAALLVAAVGGTSMKAKASPDVVPVAPAEVAGRIVDLNRQLEAVRGEFALSKIQVQRAEAVIGYSARYQIPADLAGAIYDIALSENIEPALAFRLVKLESGFKGTARSPRGAIGYTQVRLPTAKEYEPDIEERQLYRRDVNLRIGFRYMRDLVKQFKGDYEMALLAYNRGPGTVQKIVAEGGDPSNGYAAKVLRGTRTGAARTNATKSES